MVIKVIRHDGWPPVLMRHCFIRLCSTKYLDDRYICGQVSVSLNAILGMDKQVSGAAREADKRVRYIKCRSCVRPSEPLGQHRFQC